MDAALSDNVGKRCYAADRRGLAPLCCLHAAHFLSASLARVHRLRAQVYRRCALVHRVNASGAALARMDGCCIVIQAACVDAASPAAAAAADAASLLRTAARYAAHKSTRLRAAFRAWLCLPYYRDTRVRTRAFPAAMFSHCLGWLFAPAVTPRFALCLLLLFAFCGAVPFTLCFAYAHAARTRCCSSRCSASFRLRRAFACCAHLAFLRASSLIVGPSILLLPLLQ